ncbi:MAG TPA: hypothetical protein VK776_13210 [Bryobacteraceae bacterium]|nr:hypothetical protein [Bryobacteraceae bacterium]
MSPTPQRMVRMSRIDSALSPVRAHPRVVAKWQGMLPAGIGLAIGLLASLAVNRLLKSELVGVLPNDPITLLAASTTLMLAAALGCLIPARRAARIDPAVSLRH